MKGNDGTGYKICQLINRLFILIIYINGLRYFSISLIEGKIYEKSFLFYVRFVYIFTDSIL